MRVGKFQKVSWSFMNWNFQFWKFPSPTAIERNFVMLVESKARFGVLLAGWVWKKIFFTNFTNFDRIWDIYPLKKALCKSEMIWCLWAFERFLLCKSFTNRQILKPFRQVQIWQAHFSVGRLCVRLTQHVRDGVVPFAPGQRARRPGRREMAAQ